MAKDQNCWADDFRRAHEDVIKQYPFQVQNELRENREKWMRSENIECCKDDNN